MVITANIDYATTFFKYPVLDKLHGEPTYEGLKQMKKQLKANAQSVPSILSGGQFGLLSLVLSPAEYANISNIAFVESGHPAALQIPPLQHNMMSFVLEESMRKKWIPIVTVLQSKKHSSSKSWEPLTPST